MKRCPQCDFIYPDSDDVCDFDKSPLVVAPESEIAAITNTPERPALSQLATTQSNKFESRKGRRAVPMAAGIGVLLGIVVFGVYFAVHRQMTPPPVVVQPSISRPPSLSQPSPAAVETPSPQQDAAALNARTSPGLGKPSTAHSTSIGPVSTSAAATGEKSSTKIILLTSGGQVEANDVWRTRDGIWYRRDGVVTLLKKNRVKAIVSQ